VTSDQIARIVQAAHASAPLHVSVGAVDWNGRLRTKQLPIGDLEKTLREGTALTSAIFATDTAEQPMDNGVFQDPANGYRDAELGFDHASYYPDPLQTSGAGAVLLGQLAGAHAAVCPRALLARECARLATLGFNRLRDRVSRATGNVGDDPA
jgi:glutamine synthetase